MKNEKQKTIRDNAAVNMVAVKRPRIVGSDRNRNQPILFVNCTCIVKRIREQASIQATSSLRSTYTGIVLKTRKGK